MTDEVKPPEMIKDMIGQDVYVDDYVVSSNYIYKVLDVMPLAGNPHSGSIRVILIPGSKSTRPKRLYNRDFVKVDAKYVTMMILNNRLV